MVAFKQGTNGVNLVVSVSGRLPEFTSAKASHDASALLNTASLERVDLPINVPLTVQPPPGLRLEAVSVTEHRVDLLFKADGGGTILVALGRFEVPPEPQDTVDGHPGMVSDSEIIIYRIARNWSLQVSADPVNRLGGAAKLLDFIHERVHIVPDPDDRASWPTL